MSSSFGEFEHALPALARFTLMDGRQFLMTATQDENGGMQIGIIEGQPRMTRADFAQVVSLQFTDELGRHAGRATLLRPALLQD